MVESYREMSIWSIRHHRTLVHQNLTSHQQRVPPHLAINESCPSEWPANHSSRIGFVRLSLARERWNFLRRMGSLGWISYRSQRCHSQLLLPDQRSNFAWTCYLLWSMARLSCSIYTRYSTLTTPFTIDSRIASVMDQPWWLVSAPFLDD